jgi:hypothetical protein
MAKPGFPVTAFALVTNRSLGPGAQEAYDGKAVLFDELMVAQRRWLLPPASETLEVEHEFGSVENAQRAWYDILRKFTVYQRLGHDRWIEALRQYACGRGLPPELFPHALHTLVGAAIDGTVNGELELTKAWLNEHLLGFPDARSLRLSDKEESAREEALQAVRQWLKSTLGAIEQNLVRRALLNALDQEVAQHPIVLLLGMGGCGKSVLACQYLLESAGRRFVAAVCARDFTQGWMAKSYNAWCSPAHGPQLQLLPDGEVPRRLHLANPRDPRPILLVDIDGFDERDGDRNREDVRALVALCMSLATGIPPTMTVILTTRSTTGGVRHDRRKFIRDLLSAHVPEQIESRIGVIPVDDFRPEEFARVIRHVPERIAHRLESALALTPSGQEAMPDLESDAAIPCSQSISSISFARRLSGGTGSCKALACVKRSYGLPFNPSTLRRPVAALKTGLLMRRR